ncbi:MAG: DUF4352 domain-containing protein [Patescibacteria group bacterium]
MGNAQQTTEGETKKKGWFRRHKILTGIGIFFILIVIVGLLSGDETSPAPQKAQNGSSEATSNADEAQPEQSFTVGDTIKTEEFEITITDVAGRNSVGSDFFESTPAEGGVYIAVQWKYKNISDEQIGSFSTPRLTLVSPTDVEFDADIGASGNLATELDLDRKVFSSLSPGITVKDAEVFEISKEMYGDGTNWKMLVRADDDVAVEIN